MWNQDVTLAVSLRSSRNFHYASSCLAGDGSGLPGWLALTLNSGRNWDKGSNDKHTSYELVRPKGITAEMRGDDRSTFFDCTVPDVSLIDVNRPESLLRWQAVPMSLGPTGVPLCSCVLRWPVQCSRGKGSSFGSAHCHRAGLSSSVPLALPGPPPQAGHVQLQVTAELL